MAKQQYVKQKKTLTSEEDWRRMSKNLITNYGSVIHDKESFDKAYREYFQTDLVPKLNKSVIKDKLWTYTRNQLKIKKEPEDQQKPDKIKPQKPVIKKSKFEYIGKQTSYNTKRRKTVFAKKIQTKRGPRFIDKRGRYVSVKNLK